MSPQDKVQLQNWIRGKANRHDVMMAEAIGMVGNVRFTEQARRAYILLWDWSCNRFSGQIGARQDFLYKKWGSMFLDRRFARVMAKVERIKTGEF
jgi:hypothetical protein